MLESPDHNQDGGLYYQSIVQIKIQIGLFGYAAIIIMMITLNYVVVDSLFVKREQLGRK